MEKKKIIINDHEAVDLGLSVKWAAYNIGASNPEEYGLLRVWGDRTEGRIYGRKLYALWHTSWGSIYWHWKNNLRNGIRCSKQTMGG